MSVAAKFYVAEVTLTGKAHRKIPGKAGGYDTYEEIPGKYQGRVKLSAVVRGEENKEWSQATPFGEVIMQITNAPAFEEFQRRLGEEFDVLFTPANTRNGVPIE